MTASWDWREGSVVMSTGCTSVWFPAPTELLRTIYISSFRESNVFSGIQGHHTHMAHRHTPSQNTHTCKMFKKTFSQTKGCISVAELLPSKTLESSPGLQEDYTWLPCFPHTEVSNKTPTVDSSWSLWLFYDAFPYSFHCSNKKYVSCDFPQNSFPILY